MKLSIASLFTLASSCLAYSFNTSDIIAYNVSRCLYHIDVDNATDYDYWSLSVTNNSISTANGSGVTVALIGDGVNSHYLLEKDSVNSVLDVYTNKTYKFSKEELTEDTLAAKVLLANAPEAKIKSYKIFESKNSTRSYETKLSEAIVSAANDDDVDLILLNTWQQYGGWASSFFSKFINEVAEVKPIVLPMGQANGIFQFSDGAGAEKAISVGGSGFEGTLGYQTNISGEIYGIYADESLYLYSNNTLILGELDSNCYLKNNVSYDETDLLFLDVGNCTSKQVVDAVLASNFTQLLTTGETYQLYDFSEDDIIVSAMITREAGLDILQRLEDGENLVAHNLRLDAPITIDYDYDEYSINFNSSFGPSLDLVLTPNILAQSAVYFDDIEIYGSGTGLSAAFVAGSIAAYASTFDDDSWTDDLVHKVTTSGMQVNFRNLTEITAEIHNPIVQGGGIFNVEEFMQKDFEVFPGYFSLGETNSTTSFTFTLTNDGKETKRFHITGLDSVTIYAEEGDPEEYGETIYQFPTEVNSTAANVLIDKSTISVGAGKSKNVTVSIIPPDYSGENGRLPVFGGYIQVTDSTTNYMSSIPYFGTTAKMENINTQTFQGLYWKIMKDAEDGGIYMHVWDDGELVNDTDHYLQVYYGTMIGSPMVDILLVNRNWTSDDFVYPPVPGENNFVNRPYMVRSVGGYPWHYVSRTNSSWDDQWDLWHFGRLVDNTIVPNGDYRLMLRVLHHGGDPTKYDDWFNHVSAWFTFNYDNVTEVDLPSTTLSVPHSSTTLNTVSKTSSESVASSVSSPTVTSSSSSSSSSSTSMDMDMSSTTMDMDMSSTTMDMDMSSTTMDMPETSTSSLVTSTSSSHEGMLMTMTMNGHLTTMYM